MPREEHKAMSEENGTGKDLQEADAPPPAEKALFLSRTPFSSFNLPEPVARGIAEAGWNYCTRIQELALPVALEGKDLAGQAQTGTGKTAAFLVPMLTRLLEREPAVPGLPRALVVAPTRELALQIHAEANLIGKHCGFSTAAILGGMEYQKQAQALKTGADIVIGTPGRLIDYYKQGIFKTDGVEIAVVDEADRLLDLGFAKDMRYILKKLPHFGKRQTMLFSATLSYRVLDLTYEYMNLPEFLAVAPGEVTVDTVEQVLMHVGKEQKLPALLGVLAKEPWERVLVFANTKSGVRFLEQKLLGNGYKAEGITGDVPQKKRLKLMKSFKDGDLSILVATDVASRGLHIEDISHVVNYDLPQDPENYVHRIGRTARAGKTGKTFTLACEEYVLHLDDIEAKLGYRIPVVWPEEDFFVQDQAGPYIGEKRDRSAGGRGGGKKAWPGRKSKDTPGRGQRPARKPRVAEGQVAESVPAASQAGGEAAAPGGAAESQKRRRRKKRPAGENRGEANAPSARENAPGAAPEERKKRKRHRGPRRPKEEGAPPPREE